MKGVGELENCFPILSFIIRYDLMQFPISFSSPPPSFDGNLGDFLTSMYLFVNSVSTYVYKVQR